MKIILNILISLFIISCSASDAQVTPLKVVNAFPNLSFNKPLNITHTNDGSDRIFVVQQDGYIKVFPNDSNTSAAAVFLNISNKISSSNGEEGLLGLTFHPNFAANRYIYVDYTAPNPLHTVISRFTVSASDPNKVDSLSEYIILTINQPYSNHNGGTVMFGNDGYLYIGMGDGGSAGDPQNNAQNTQVLLGKMLRIDVNDTTSSTRYVIPPTNPFYNNPSSGRGEIFCWGLRNPWKYSQDPVTGLIYCGDVGQDLYEEVDIITNGGNYGWRVKEGYSCYNAATCDSTGFTSPIKVYSHSNGQCSITGGYVYRGQRRPELTGAYIYSDYCAGKIRMLRYSNGLVTADSIVSDTAIVISSFGTDKNNELYIAGYSSGKIYKFSNGNSNSIQGNGQVVKDFELRQNFPNPFNPSTTIEYSIPKLSYVRLYVYNVLGQEVARLVDNTLPEGTYKVMWKSANQPSGIYFYKMFTEVNSISKEMVIVK